MQTILNTPLASADTLGVSSGAGLGAATMIVLGSPLALPKARAVPLAAFASASLTCGLVRMIDSVRGGDRRRAGGRWHRPDVPLLGAGGCTLSS